MRTTIAWTLALLCALLLVGPSLSAAFAADPAGTPAGPTGAKVAPGVWQAVEQAGGAALVPVIITMKQQADLSGIVAADRDERVRQVVQRLKDTASASQASITAFLAQERAQGNAGPVTHFWVFNGLAVSVNAAALAGLAQRPDVANITPNETFQAPSAQTFTSPAEPNLSAINAPALWDLGYTGQGIVVANVDTGVSVNHTDLNAQWRGGTNSWFDPYDPYSATPVDLSGHGTQTMGVIVGRDAGGTVIGVAPDAQWIAARIFNDSGQATTSGIHAAYQWLLDPDGDPGTADAPHVVNSSWSFGSPGCNVEFRLDLQALRAANILPIFSAGNFGPGGATSASPANYPESFAIGAIDDANQIYVESSRGPSSCGEAQSVFPEMVAPGVGIRTADRYNLYTDATGTSIAAPHAAGALALLLSAYPNLTADEQVDALLASAFDLGATGSDNDFGYGRLDAFAAYEFVSSTTPPPTPTPVPTVNLALNRPVTVSSAIDDAHTGNKAVDGDLNSYWQTAKAKGKNVLPSEWIVVDLGSSTAIDGVTLEWDSNYATEYSIEASTDGSAWTTVFSTATGDGGSDAITFAAVAARYIRMDSTAWSSASQRNWLRELEIYGTGGSLPTPTLPPPTATPAPPTTTPTAEPPTATPAPPTATPTPGTQAILHVGDLDGSSAPVRRKWAATVSILVHDAAEAPVANATVSGSWIDGASGGAGCVTDGTGWCDIAATNLKTDVASVTFAVSDIAMGSATYQPGDNHDPDLDSDGTTITISAP